MAQKKCINRVGPKIEPWGTSYLKKSPETIAVVGFTSLIPICYVVLNNP